ncbi:hypothetical protein NCCP2716_21750 [Sporosarcina sp. NCCP-2716]|nr:hypothetical protein NCCP2716_21750 [Sporosarcina sp. NCCP-2716]
MAAVTFLTSACLILGVLYRVPAAEKEDGLTGQFDVAADGTIAYVTQENGKPSLSVKSDVNELLVQLPTDRSILDIAITADGESVLYAVSDKELGTESRSTVFRLDRLTGESGKLFSADAVITELVMDPKAADRLFYLQADRFSDYSPGAMLYPYGFDVHSYDLARGQHEKHTDMDRQSMSSLQVSAEEEAVYVQMDEETGGRGTAEEVDAVGRIFKIPLSDPDRKLVISIPEDTADLYDFVLIPERSELIYQAIAGTDEDGFLEYELFSYNWGTQQIEKLTRLHAYAGTPIYGMDGRVYFMADEAFGRNDSDVKLYSMEPDGRTLVQIDLDS